MNEARRRHHAPSAAVAALLPAALGLLAARGLPAAAAAAATAASASSVSWATAAEATAQAAEPKGTPLKEQFPWYHTADEISAGFRSLVGHCGGAHVDIFQRADKNATGRAAQLDVLRLSKAGTGEGQAKTRAMLVFGEHARELITPESALHFVKALCGSGPSARRASAILDRVEFTIVPNGNPLGRKEVEEGFYCKRTNENGVDLNRNFGDAHRLPDARAQLPGDARYPGPRGFSEPESRVLRGLVEEVRPDVYVSVHSGGFLLGTPFGYAAGKVPANEANLLEVLGPISKKYFGGDCPYGSLPELISYDSPGCDMDYVAEQAGTPYVFTWEIYAGQGFRERYVREARARRGEGRADRGSGGGGPGGLSRAEKEEGGAGQPKRMLRAGRSRSRSFHTVGGHGRQGLAAGAAARAETLTRQAAASLASAMSGARQPEAQGDVATCLRMFNPQTAQEMESVLVSWTGAYLELCEEVATRQQGGRP